MTSDEISNGAGGYDDGYRTVPCFWGREPGSFVRRLAEHYCDPSGMRVVDAGAGEGKNAVYLARLGATVDAIDISSAALQNARRQWGSPAGVRWHHADIRIWQIDDVGIDIVVLYGLLHCLRGPAEISAVVNRLQESTPKHGFHVLCAFNDELQELHAHPGLRPTLLSHRDYLELYSNWDVKEASNEILRESHPNRNLQHRHSITRLIAMKT